MAFCMNCGTQFSSRHCPDCGTEVGSNGPHATAAAAGVGVAIAAAPSFAHPPQQAQLVPQGWAPPATKPVSSMGTTDKNQFTHTAHQMLGTSGERIAWQGQPSWKCLATRMAGWGAVYFLALFWGGFGLGVFVLFLGLVHVGVGYWGLSHTHYKLSSQRLEVKRGWLSQTNNTFNLIEINQVRIVRPFPLPLLGLANMQLDVVDPESSAAAPKMLELRGLVDAEVLRDLIHSSSNLAGQLWDERRFGA